jgi:hypothetical protein
MIVVDSNLIVEPSNRVMSKGEFMIKSDKRVLYVQVGGKDPKQRVADWLDAFQDMVASRPRVARKESGFNPHPFGSFSPSRSNCPAAWYVCGRSYLGAVATALKAARRQV